MLLVESNPLVRYTGSSHFSHPVSCIEIELLKDGSAVVCKFPLFVLTERKLADNYIICCAKKIQP